MGHKVSYAIALDLIRGLDTSLSRRMIVEGVLRIAQSLGIIVIAAGIETVGEYEALRAMGVRYIQGYLLARPGFKSLPRVTLPGRDRYAAVA